MDFFAQQDKARSRTGWLIFYYILAMTATFVAVYALFVFAAVLLLGNTGDATAEAAGYATALERNYYFDFPILAVTSGFVLLVIGGGSLFKIMELSAGGGGSVATALGGREISQMTDNPAEKRLMNIVEEMAIASGISVPLVYVLDNESRINAFAAGSTPNTAAVAVTKGTLEYLSRDELQGVVAHEFSHILNGDMRLNLRLIGVLFGLNVLVILGFQMFRIAAYSGGGRRSGKDGGANIGLVLLVLGGGLAIIGGIGRLFSMLIQAAICRQREHLADASAVQFTRNPAGIAGALKKIGSPTLGSKLDAPSAIEASHLMFSSGLSSFLSGTAFATHPPLGLRIKMIDPSFDGKFPANVEKASNFNAAREDTVKKITPQKTQDMLSRIGQINIEQLCVAASLLAGIPDEANSVLATPDGAASLILATLSHKKEGEMERSVMTQIVNSIPHESRIPLVQKAFPALRKMSAPQYKTFRKTVNSLMSTDGSMSLFEFTLHSMLLKDLDIHFGLAKPNVVQYYSQSGLKKPFSLVLSYLAYNGAESDDEAKKAFDEGAKAWGENIVFVPKSECTLQAFSESLKHLDESCMKIKKQILTSLSACVSADNVMTSKEGELMRAVSAVLGCPVSI